MTNLRLLAAKYGNHTTVRFVYLVVALAALALAAGAPDCIGGTHCP